MFLNCLAIHESISNEDRATLESIALTTPYLSGDAVYTARVLLGIEASTYGIAYRKPAPVFAPAAISFYPNPSNGELSITFEEASENIRIFNCYDLSGKKLYSKQIAATASKEKINLTHLSSGIYLIDIEEKGMVVYKEKMILTH